HFPIDFDFDSFGLYWGESELREQFSQLVCDPVRMSTNKLPPVATLLSQRQPFQQRLDRQKPALSVFTQPTFASATSFYSIPIHVLFSPSVYLCFSPIAPKKDAKKTAFGQFSYVNGFANEKDKKNRRWQCFAEVWTSA